MSKLVGVSDSELKEYIDRHNNYEHNYLNADGTEAGEYDICMECDCTRHIDAMEWAVV
jgi:hypothetical protein